MSNAETGGVSPEQLERGYQTTQGTMICGDSAQLLSESVDPSHRPQLILTSPPFPLNRKKEYGNLQGEEYLEWISSFGSRFEDLLPKNGSLVIEIGNAWESGEPAMSTLPVEALIRLKESTGLRLCQQFIAFNPARLPSPAQWVTKERIRVKDSFTRIWWLSPSTRPKADNRRVLQEYSDSMKDLLDRQDYHSEERPSGHDIGEESFLTDNGGSIPPNVLKATNTTSADPYLQFCQEIGIEPHPARMAPDLASFFIQFLTEKEDLVLDPFAGSNMTGFQADRLGREWLGIEADCEYVKGSAGRFLENNLVVDPVLEASKSDLSALLEGTG